MDVAAKDIGITSKVNRAEERSNWKTAWMLGSIDSLDRRIELFKKNEVKGGNDLLQSSLAILINSVNPHMQDRDKIPARFANHNNFAQFVEDLQKTVDPDLEKWGFKDKLALCLKSCLEMARHPKDNEVEIGHGLKFVRIHPEASRDRVTFLQQQGEKYGYDSNSSELVDLMLLHTAKVGESKTKYMKLQERNLETAREQFVEGLEIPHTISGIRWLESLLLKDLVPAGQENLLRDSEAVIDNRGGYLVSPAKIESATRQFLENVNSSLEHFDPAMPREDVVKMIAFWRLTYDIIHPLREGNGRSGSVLVSNWTKRLLNANFQPSRMDGYRYSGFVNRDSRKIFEICPTPDDFITKVIKDKDSWKSMSEVHEFARFLDEQLVAIV